MVPLAASVLRYRRSGLAAARNFTPHSSTEQDLARDTLPVTQENAGTTTTKSFRGCGEPGRA